MVDGHCDSQLCLVVKCLPSFFESRAFSTRVLSADSTKGIQPVRQYLSSNLASLFDDYQVWKLAMKSSFFCFSLVFDCMDSSLEVDLCSVNWSCIYYYFVSG